MTELQTWRDQILLEMSNTLKPLGFKKQGTTFRKLEGGVWRVANLQSSQWNRQGEMTVFVNLALWYVECMIDETDRARKAPHAYGGSHWSARLKPQDGQTFCATTASSLSAMAKEIAAGCKCVLTETVDCFPTAETLMLAYRRGENTAHALTSEAYPSRNFRRRFLRDRKFHDSLRLARIEFGSQEFEKELSLRRRVLRWPLALDFTEEQIAEESTDTHLGIFDGRDPVAVLVLTPLENGLIKMRQVAVEPDAQGQGIGRRLVEYSEVVACDAGFREMVLSARQTAVAFYIALGYVVVGEPYEEVTIPHRKMIKKLV